MALKWISNAFQLLITDDDLRKKLHKHNLTRLSIKKPGLIEKRINNGTKKLFDNIESLTAHPVIE